MRNIAGPAAMQLGRMAMGLKEILVFADGAPDGLARVRMALELARAAKAHLEIRSFTQLPPFPVTEAAGALADAYAHTQALAARAADSAMAAIGAIAREGPELSVYRQDAAPGEARRLAGVLARTADLVVLGRPEEIDRSGLDTELTEGALMSGGRPCLVLPRWVDPRPWGRRALVAWKGTPEAARAVAGAAPLLANAEAVRICTVNPRSGRRGEDERALSRLATYLMRHGAVVEGTVAVASESDEEVDESIRGQSETFGADLLVMGAYGHSRWREWAFGGVTRAMLNSSPIPLLMAH